MGAIPSSLLSAAPSGFPGTYKFAGIPADSGGWPSFFFDGPPDTALISYSNSQFKNSYWFNLKMVKLLYLIRGSDKPA
jgi:hypothetical protein